MTFKRRKVTNVAVLVAAGAPPSTTAFDPVFGGATLTNGNLTATNSSSGYLNARTVASHSTGKFYWEITINSLGASGDSCISIVNGSAANSGFYGFDASLSLGVFDNNVAAFINSSSIGTATSAGWTVSNVISNAVDLTNKLFWLAVNGGNWNGSGTANPATGIGGLSLSTLAAGPYYAAISVQASQVTANFGATAYSNTPPSGFGNL